MVSVTGGVASFWLLGDMDTAPNFYAVVRAVSSIIDAWDLYGFLKNGAPSNEYDTESEAIARRLDEIQSASNAARVVSEVFSNYLGLDLPSEDAIRIGEQLYATLREADLIKLQAGL